MAIIRLYPDKTMLGGHPADCKRRIDTLLAAGATKTARKGPDESREARPHQVRRVR